MTRDIRATRDRLALSTAELARLVGVSNRSAHAWLAGAPVPEPVWRLLEVFSAVDPKFLKQLAAPPMERPDIIETFEESCRKVFMEYLQQISELAA